MAEPALDLSLVREFPLAWTTAGLEQWMARLPAHERAAMRWALPDLEAALEPLLNGPLDPPVLDAATHSYIRVVKGCSSVILRMLADDIPMEPLYQPWLDRIPALRAFLVSPISGDHAEKSLRWVIGLSLRNWKQLRQLSTQERAELNQRMLEHDFEFLNEGPGAEVSRATLLVSALLEAMPRGVPMGRGRELARLALRHVMRGLDGLYRQGFEYYEHLSMVESSVEDREDSYLDAAATLVLAGRGNLVHELGWQAPPIDFTAFEALQKKLLNGASTPPKPRIRRFTANISCVAFRPVPAISLEGDLTWYTATGPLVERAMLLREKPILATLLAGVQPRLIRIDPADGAPVSDKNVRTRDMLHDWDELLERLAK